MKIVNILIIDSHKITRAGIKFFLNVPASKYKFHIEEADSGSEAIKKAKKTFFELIIMDCRMEEMPADDCARMMLKICPGVKILCLSVCKKKESVNKMLHAGLSGFVYKNIDGPELLKAIDVVLNDKKYFCNEAALSMMDFYESKNKNKIPAILSKRESQISHLIINEFSNKEIARKLSISIRTVGKHKENLAKKLKAKNMTGLVNRINQLTLSDSYNSTVY